MFLSLLWKSNIHLLFIFALIFSSFIYLFYLFIYLLIYFSSFDQFISKIDRGAF